MVKARNYKLEYKKYHSSPAARAARSRRTLDRIKAVKAGRVRKGDKSKHVHHTAGGARGKTRVISAKRNLGMRERSRLKGSRRNTRRRGR